MRRRLAASSPGFTLIELVVVLAIVGAMAALAIPALGRFNDTERAKEYALRVAAALRTGRVSAMKEGIPYLVIIRPRGAVVGPPLSAGTYLTVARVVRDDNGDFVESAGDTLAINFDATADPQVDWYTPGTDGFDALAQPEPITAGGTLGGALSGSTFPDSPGGAPETVVVFNGRGVPFNWAAPGALGLSGGAYVLAGGNVYAAAMGPLGEVRVLAGGPTGWN